MENLIALVKLKTLFLWLCIDQLDFPKIDGSPRLPHTTFKPQTMPVVPYQHGHFSESIYISKVYCTLFFPLLFFSFLSDGRRITACQSGLPGPALLLPLA